MEVFMVRANKGCIICGDPKIEAHNLCRLHYERQRRTGTFESARPTDWGKRDKHPLYERWKSMFRQGGRSPEWEDFWQYVTDIGEPPADSRLHRLRGDEPWGPANFEWKQLEYHGVPQKGELRNAYMREWRSKNYGRARNNEMKSHRGMSIAEYDALLEAQGGGCAICGKIDPNFRLAIDHDHRTGANRGLLCSNCNRGLGLLGDDRTLLLAAIAYLASHTLKAEADGIALIAASHPEREGTSGEREVNERALQEQLADAEFTTDVLIKGSARIVLDPASWRDVRETFGQ